LISGEEIFIHGGELQITDLTYFMATFNPHDCGIFGIRINRVFLDLKREIISVIDDSRTDPDVV
jgi:hypothetical protein